MRSCTNEGLVKKSSGREWRHPSPQLAYLMSLAGGNERGKSDVVISACWKTCWTTHCSFPNPNSAFDHCSQADRIPEKDMTNVQHDVLHHFVA